MKGFRYLVPVEDKSLHKHFSLKFISALLAIILCMGQPGLVRAAFISDEPIATIETMTTATQPVTDTTTATADTSSTAPEDPTITFYTSGPLDTATTTSAEETVSPTVTLTCSDGELVNGQCEKKTSTAPTCEGGAVAVDGYCPVSTYHELQCIDGTAAVGGKCSTTSSYASSCPSGATAVSGTNQCTSSSLAICPSGSILEVGNHCLNLMTELYSTATCPSGSILSGGQCIKNTLALCTAGDTLQSNGQCIKTTTTAAVCAADEALTSGGQCVKTTFVQASCPGGTLETDGLCHSTANYLPNAASTTAPTAAVSTGTPLASAEALAMALLTATSGATTSTSPTWFDWDRDFFKKVPFYSCIIPLQVELIDTPSGQQFSIDGSTPLNPEDNGLMEKWGVPGNYNFFTLLVIDPFGVESDDIIINFIGGNIRYIRLIYVPTAILWPPEGLELLYDHN